eukprot:GFYU01007842.1.p1 GENE.GFYU01007842.1~~GFYU01007842.1.p1  ORF type:complete len:156 (-),score=29.39 GFYU01007842.1:170-601(-)
MSAPQPVKPEDKLPYIRQLTELFSSTKLVLDALQQVIAESSSGRPMTPATLVEVESKLASFDSRCDSFSTLLTTAKEAVLQNSSDAPHALSGGLSVPNISLMPASSQATTAPDFFLKLREAVQNTDDLKDSLRGLQTALGTLE